MLEVPVTMTGPTGRYHVANYIVDTGASYTLVTNTDVQDLRLQRTGTAMVATANGAIQMPMYAASIDANGEHIDGATVMVNPGGVRVLGLDIIRKIGLTVHPQGA